MEDELAGDASENEFEVRRRINRQAKKEKPRKTTTRFDELSTPPRRILLDTYQHHAHLFPKERLEKMQQILQESYAMTPEETEKYFEQVKTEENEIAKHKVEKMILKRLFKQQQRLKQERKAYRVAGKRLRQVMMPLSDKTIPPLASARMKHLTDIILQQICSIRNIDASDIDSLPNQLGSFLVSLANWTAVVVEQVYYTAELKKNEELAMIEDQIIKDKGVKKEKKWEEEKSEMTMEEEESYLYETDLE